MKLNLVFIALVTFSMTSAFAALNPASKKLTELFEVMDMEQTQDTTIHEMVQAQIAANPALKELETEYIAFMRKYVSFKALEKDARELYAKNYNEKEIEDLIEFYKTSTGRKTLDVTPKMMAELAMIGQKRATEGLPELTKAFEAKMKKKK